MPTAARCAHGHRAGTTSYTDTFEQDMERGSTEKNGLWKMECGSAQDMERGSTEKNGLWKMECGSNEKNELWKMKRGSAQEMEHGTTDLGMHCSLDFGDADLVVAKMMKPLPLARQQKLGKIWYHSEGRCLTPAALKLIQAGLAGLSSSRRCVIAKASFRLGMVSKQSMSTWSGRNAVLAEWPGQIPCGALD
eukprot:1148653-Pelagomonas_calceolata.AAC.3